MESFAYRGHLVTVIPDRDAEEGLWLARVAIDIRTPQGAERIYYTDHLRTYPDEAEARRASETFGRRMIDTFIVPSAGEGV